MSSALTDADGHLIAQGRDIPMHMGVMSFTVREFLKRVPKSRLAHGDVWFLNLPEIGGNHLPDVKAIRPVFVDGAIVAFAVNLAHWADIGGAVPGSYVAGATDAWQEGLRIPPFRLFTADGPLRENLDMVLANVRGAQEREGDILAQMAATRGAEAQLRHIFAEHGTDTVLGAVAAIHDRAEAQMREAIAAIPDGTYTGEDWLDDDAAGGEPVAVRVRVTIAGDGATFDFSETADAARGPVNTTPFIAAASVFYVVKTLFGPDIQPSGGCYRPVEIVTRPGSLLDPGPERPVVGGNHETSQRVADAVFRALEPTGPERLSAGGPTTSGLVLFGGRRADGVWTTFYETHGGGEGARHDRDGAPVVRVHMSNVIEHPGRGGGGAISDPRRVPAPARRLGRGGAAARRRRPAPGVPGAVRRHVRHHDVRASCGAALRVAGRCAGGDVSSDRGSCARSPIRAARQGQRPARPQRRRRRRELWRRRIRSARSNRFAGWLAHGFTGHVERPSSMRLNPGPRTISRYGVRTGIDAPAVRRSD